MRLLVSIIILCFAMNISAEGKKNLPDIQVKNHTQQLLSLNAMVPEGKWILIYSRAECSSCEAIFSFLSEPENKEANESVMVLIDGSDENIQAIRQSYPAVSFLQDFERLAFAALQLKGTPVILGIKDNKVQWTLSGIPQNDRIWKSALVKW